MPESLRINIVRTPLVQAAGLAIRLTRWWLAYLVVFFIVIGAALLVAPVAPFLETSGVPMLAQFAAVIFHLVAFGLLIAWVKWWERRPPRSLGLPQPADRRALVRGFGVGVAGFAVITALLMLLGAVHLTPTDSGPIRWSAVIPALVMIPLWGVMALVEEALTRGFLLQVTALQLAAWTAIVGQAVLWAIIRSAGLGDTDPLALLNLVLFGIALAFVALSQGSLWWAIGIQAGWSWFETSILGLFLVGGPGSNSLVNLVPTSASWISGGAFGVVASPVVTIALVAATIWIYRRFVAQMDAGQRIP